MLSETYNQTISSLASFFKCPKTGGDMSAQSDCILSNSDASVSFSFEDGILRAFLSSESKESVLSERVKEFYEKTPFPNYDEMDNLGSLIEKSRERQFPEMLNQSIPPNAKVLEVGCGTGQLGNFLSIAGRTVLSVDMCWNSLRLAQHFKEKNNLRNVSFAQMNLFRLPLKPGTFDCVICTGVLHHTGTPYEGFQGLLPLVKPGGHIIIGLYNHYGRMQTKIRSVFFKIFGEKFAAIDPYLRQHHVKDAKKSAWFQDQYCHPHETCHTIDEVLGWFKNNHIEFIRAFPSTVLGDNFKLEYHQSLFNKHSEGSYIDRLASQLRQMFTDTEGGLFIMIGKKS